jgi:hypothetical protein
MTTKKEVTRHDEGQLAFSNEMPEGYEKGEGRGISNRAEDNLIPMIIVLQPLSPQLDKKSEKYIEGAEAGTILLKNGPGEGMVSGDRGFLFQPCDFKPIWIEWVDRDKGGGFVARYEDNNGRPELKIARKHQSNRFIYVNPETGNNISNHHNHVGYVISEHGEHEPLPAMISFKSAGITESRAWNTMLPRERPDGSQSDSFDAVYRIISLEKKNSKGRWFDLHASKRMGWVSARQQKLGKALADQHKRGDVQGDFSEANTAAEPAEDTM